jgi:hypothetical protein
MLYINEAIIMDNKERCRQWKEKNPEKVKEWTERNKHTLRKRAREWTTANREKVLEMAEVRRQANRSFIDSIKISVGCQNPNCEWSGVFEGCDLDFHHKDPLQKERTVAMLTSCSKKKIITEMNKCIVLCAICHRRAHNQLLDCSALPLCEVS